MPGSVVFALPMELMLPWLPEAASPNGCEQASDPLLNQR